MTSISSRVRLMGAFCVGGQAGPCRTKLRRVGDPVAYGHGLGAASSGTSMRPGVARFARAWLPPVAAKALSRADKRSSTVYASYAEALASCKTSYEDDELARVVAAKTEAFAALMASSRQLDFAAVRTLAGLASSKAQSDSLTVLDFGGQAGYHYFIARRILPSDVNLKWRVVETRAMAKAASRLANSELNFFNSISEAISPENIREIPDLVFASVYCTAFPIR
jgi:hypothetical protein